MKLLTTEEQQLIVEIWKRQLREQAIIEMSYFLKYNFPHLSKKERVSPDLVSIGVCLSPNERVVQIAGITCEAYIKTGYVLSNSPLSKEESIDLFEQMLKEELERQIVFYGSANK